MLRKRHARKVDFGAARISRNNFTYFRAACCNGGDDKEAYLLSTPRPGGEYRDVCKNVFTEHYSDKIYTVVYLASYQPAYLLSLRVVSWQCGKRHPRCIRAQAASVPVKLASLINRLYTLHLRFSYRRNRFNKFYINVIILNLANVTELWMLYRN